MHSVFRGASEGKVRAFSQAWSRVPDRLSSTHPIPSSHAVTDPAPWTTLSDQHLHDCKIIDIHEVKAASPITGAPHTFYRIVSPDWVNVIPLTPDGDVVLVRQFRHGTREVTLEIPGGMVDAGETPAEAAVRELREETGYVGADVEDLGSVDTNPALFDNRCHTYLVTDCREVAEIANEGAEETHVVTIPLAEIPDLIRSGAITHSLVVAAFHRLGLRD